MLIIPTKKKKSIYDTNIKRFKRSIIISNNDGLPGNIYNIRLINLSLQKGEGPKTTKWDHLIQNIQYYGYVENPFLEKNKLNPNAKINFQNVSYSIYSKEEYDNNMTFVDYYQSMLFQIPNKYMTMNDDIKIPEPKFYTEEHQIIVEDSEIEDQTPLSMYFDEYGIAEELSSDNLPLNKKIYQLYELIDPNTVMKYGGDEIQISKFNVNRNINPSEVELESFLITKNKDMVRLLYYILGHLHYSLVNYNIYEMIFIFDLNNGFNITKLHTLDLYADNLDMKKKMEESFIDRIHSVYKFIKEYIQIDFTRLYMIISYRLEGIEVKIVDCSDSEFIGKHYNFDMSLIHEYTVDASMEML